MYTATRRARLEAREAGFLVYYKMKKGLQTMTLPFAKFAWEVLVPVKNGRMFTLPRFVDCEFSCGHDAMHWWTQFLFRVTKNGGETSHTVFPHIVSILEQFPPLNSFLTFM